MEDKEIIGYKVIKDFPCKDNRFKIGFELYATKFGEHGWGEWPNIAKKYTDYFKPIYKPKYLLPKINGYEGKKVSEDAVKYGCKTISIDTLRGVIGLGINYISMGEGNIRIEQIEQIVEYFDNK